MSGNPYRISNSMGTKASLANKITKGLRIAISVELGCRQCGSGSYQAAYDALNMRVLPGEMEARSFSAGF
jgi:hypothetical protein